MGLIKRTGGSKDSQCFSVLHLSPVRPILQYAVSVWSSYLKNNFVERENVQRGEPKCALGTHWINMEYDN